MAKKREESAESESWGYSYLKVHTPYTPNRKGPRKLAADGTSLTNVFSGRGGGNRTRAGWMRELALGTAMLHFSTLLLLVISS